MIIINRTLKRMKIMKPQGSYIKELPVSTKHRSRHERQRQEMTNLNLLVKYK